MPCPRYLRLTCAHVTSRPREKFADRDPCPSFVVGEEFSVHLSLSAVVICLEISVSAVTPSDNKQPINVSRDYRVHHVPVRYNGKASTYSCLPVSAQVYPQTRLEWQKVVPSELTDSVIVIVRRLLSQRHVCRRFAHRLNSRDIPVVVLLTIETDDKATPAIDGNWGSWEPWSTCPVTCGEGRIQRFRVCNNPPPSNGGAFCEGETLESGTCQGLPPCPAEDLGTLPPLTVRPVATDDCACGCTLRDPLGGVTRPPYGACAGVVTWLIWVLEDYRIRLEFEVFDLDETQERIKNQNHHSGPLSSRARFAPKYRPDQTCLSAGIEPPCANKMVKLCFQIRDGGEATSPLLFSSGSVDPPATLTSSGSRLYIEFRVQADLQAYSTRGFRAGYSSFRKYHIPQREPFSGSGFPSVDCGDRVVGMSNEERLKPRICKSCGTSETTRPSFLIRRKTETNYTGKKLVPSTTAVTTTAAPEEPLTWWQKVEKFFKLEIFQNPVTVAGIVLCALVVIGSIIAVICTRMCRRRKRTAAYAASSAQSEIEGGGTQSPRSLSLNHIEATSVGAQSQRSGRDRREHHLSDMSMSDLSHTSRRKPMQNGKVPTGYANHIYSASAPETPQRFTNLGDRPASPVQGQFPTPYQLAQEQLKLMRQHGLDHCEQLYDFRQV
ncbi:hypothetical protein Bbelb_136140 [Branchiostoma belcheri]|nr:hypothetical protein Bbelb_136140 [Branchiostoma belcheri]